jgi:hypothetical protein
MITKFKVFWHDQDEEQEQWLREMASQGLHLKRVTTFSSWTFAEGAPEDVTYRVNYSDKNRDSREFANIEHAGWECAGDAAGWYYWRRPAADAASQKLFTDPASRIAGHKRMLATLALLIMPFILMATTAWRSAPFPLLTVGMLAVTAPLCAYIFARLLRRIAALRLARG